MKVNEQVQKQMTEGFGLMLVGGLEEGAKMLLTALADIVPETPEEEQAKLDAIKQGRAALAEIKTGADLSDRSDLGVIAWVAGVVTTEAGKS